MNLRSRGLWLSGRAIVIASSEEKAIELVRSHEQTINFQGIEVLDRGPVLEGVIYNLNGDY